MQNNSQILSISNYPEARRYFDQLRLAKNQIKIPYISVVTAVKNDEYKLVKTIESLKQQSFSDFEHLIINAGEKLNIISDSLILNEPDLGISDAFNKGISAARGEVILILNAGDEYYPDSIEKVAKIFSENKSLDVLCASACFLDFEESNFYRFSDHDKLKKYMSVVHPATFVRRSVYEKIGLFQLNYKCAMDYELLLRAKNGNVNFLNHDEVLVCFTAGGNSDRFWLKSFFECVKARRKYNSSSIAEDLFQLIYNATYQVLRKAKLYALIKCFRRYFPTLSYYKT